MPVLATFGGSSLRNFGFQAGSGSSGPAAVGDFESIATTTVGVGGATNIEFTSISQTYTHLQIRGTTYNSSTSRDVFAQFNSDTGSNYSRHGLYGDGATPDKFAVAPDVNMSVGYTSLTSNVFGVSIIDILDYTNTNKHKTIRVFCGFDTNGAGFSVLYSGNWRSTSAITSIKLFPGNGNFNQYSSFALYGVKA